jgi:hypothetical protein
MSSRVLIPLLCAGAVAFACGPRPRNEAATSTKSAATVAQADSKTAPLQLQGSSRATSREKKSPVSAQISVRRSDGNIQLALRVVNTGKKKVEIKFPSGQTYDFVVLDSAGNEMWRWGNDRMFTQAVRNKLLGAGEALDYEESLKSKPLTPGRYLARATLTSANYPLVEEAEFTVTATTIASR